MFLPTDLLDELDRYVRILRKEAPGASRGDVLSEALRVIQKMLGHASIKTTERYSRVDVNAVKAAVRALDRGSLNSAVNSGAPVGSAAAPGASGGSGPDRNRTFRVTEGAIREAGRALDSKLLSGRATPETATPAASVRSETRPQG